MARGFKAVTAAAQDITERKNASGGDFIRRKYFRISDGESAIVRFLEEGEDVSSVWTHKTLPSGKFKYGRYVPCRNQDPETGEPNGEDCPGCEDENKEVRKKRFRGYINVLWYDAPVFFVDDEGKTNYNKVVGNENQVAIWETGIEVFEDLGILDEDWKGLTSRPFKVRRRGEKLDTKYSISPADPDGGAKELTNGEKELIAEKYDLNELTSPGSYETWGKFGSSDTEKESITAVNADVSPFKNRKKNLQTAEVPF